MRILLAHKNDAQAVGKRISEVRFNHEVEAPKARTSCVKIEDHNMAPPPVQPQPQQQQPQQPQQPQHQQSWKDICSNANMDDDEDVHLPAV